MGAKTMNLNRRLGVSALLCGLAAPLAGSPYRQVRGQFDAQAMARLIMDGEDHVSALTLAAWIRASKPGLRVIDVRSPGEFREFAIPTAENLPLDVLLQTRFGAGDVIVLYSEGGAHAGQAWTLLRAMGVHNAWFIAGGLADWHDEVLEPVLAKDASPAEALAFEKTAELSRYFGGTPSIGERAPAPRGTAHAAAAGTTRMRRRGC
jgi:rhodanese-related sulfurtransferase